MNWQRSNRKIHYWGSIFCALPLLIILLTGFLLLFKKQSDWVQPPTMKGTEGAPSLLYEDLLKNLQAIPEMEVESWDDVDRLDVRPSKGVIKVRGKNVFLGYFKDEDATSATLIDGWLHSGDPSFIQHAVL